MLEVTFQVKGPQAMQKLGAKLARLVQKQHLVIYLEGDLGAGKTTLVRGVLRALGYKGLVKSPTFNVYEVYQVAGLTIYHCDLYRLGDPVELEYIGLRDCWELPASFFIEWPVQHGLPPPDLRCLIQGSGKTRKVTFIGMKYVDQIS